MNKIYTNIQSWGNTLFVRYIQDSKRDLEKIQDFHPRVWIPASSSKESTGFQTLSGYPVLEFDAGDIRSTRDFITQNRDIDNFAVYGNIQPEYQWISVACPGAIPWKISDIVIAYVDIETTCENGFPDIGTANEEVIAITLSFSNLKKKIVFGCKEYTKEIQNGIYVKCDSEEKLIEEFLKVWKNNYPDIVSGWNVKFFDIPYLVNRTAKLFGENKIKNYSPWKIMRPETIEIMGKKQQTYDMFGIAILDYLDLYKKFTYTNQESYKLDHIASVELNQKKLDYSEYGSLHLLYKNNWELFIDYNVHDVDLVVALENKMKLIELAITMAYDAKVNFDDVFSQVRMWDVIIYNHLLTKGIVIPDRQESRKESIEGAYVKEPIPGFYNWVVSFDLQSLYPHLIMGGNFSPETIVDKIVSVNIDNLVNKNTDLSILKENNWSMSATGQLYSRDKYGFLPELMDWMFEQRKIYKSKMIQAEKDLEKAKASGEPIQDLINDISKYKNLQMAKKIALNSAYGALANKYFRFYNKQIAESITVSGQLAIRWIARKLNEYLNKILKTNNKDYVIAIDTDSCYLNLDPLVGAFFKNKSKEEIIILLDKICSEEINKYIDKSYEELADYVNSYSQKMIMKREAIADRGIWTAKKRYILNVWDSEGVRYAEPKLKIMGIEAVKSSTPSFCRSKIKEGLKIIMSKGQDDLIAFISEVKKEFMKLPPEDIAFPRGVNNLAEYRSREIIYKKGTPIHVRGSLLYNHYIEKMNLSKEYRNINEGDKIKFLYLKEPNNIKENIISFPSILPKELNLHSFIDYDMQFKKTFIEPLSIILDAIKWNFEKKSTLDSFFD
jgi:DNA polymerase elongation subunit (family B)